MVTAKTAHVCAHTQKPTKNQPKKRKHHKTKKTNKHTANVTTVLRHGQHSVYKQWNWLGRIDKLECVNRLIWCSNTVCYFVFTVIAVSY